MESTNKNIYSIVVTYNGDNWIEKCLNSLLNSVVHDFNHIIIVIDNNSTDKTVEIIENNFPWIILIKPNENLGFGRANNEGIKIALKQDADFIFLLNQDAWIETNTIQRLIELSLANTEFGVLSPMQLSADGTWDKQFLKYYENSFEVNKDLRECSFVNASGWLLTRKCLEKAGGFSPLFFHYGEDVDYCNRVKYHKLKVGIATNISYVHDRGARDNDQISLSKQIKQAYTNQLVKLSNVRHNFYLLLMSQYVNILRKILDKRSNPKHITTSAFIKGAFNSQKKIRQILIFRKRYRSKENYMFLVEN